MSDYTFALFLGFSGIWIVLGMLVIAWVVRAEGQTFQISRDMILVALSILVPFMIALLVGIWR